MIHSLTQREREVWQACDDLISMGKTPKEITGEAICWRLRELNYKAGSKTYIYKYRDSWMMARGLSREDDAQKIENELLSDPIVRATNIFKEGLERELTQTYELKFESLEKALLESEETKQILQQQVDALEIIQAEQEQQNESLKNVCEEKTAAYQNLHEEMIQLKVQYTSLKTQRDAEAEQYCSSLIQFEQQQSIYQAETKKHLDQIEQEFKAQVSTLKEQSEAQRHRLISDLDQSNTKNQQLETKLISEQKKIALLTTRCQQLEQTIHLLKNQTQLAVSIENSQQQQTVLINQQFEVQQQDLLRLNKSHVNLSKTLSSHQKLLEKLNKSYEQLLLKTNYRQPAKKSKVDVK